MEVSLKIRSVLRSIWYILCFYLAASTHQERAVWLEGETLTLAVTLSEQVSVYSRRIQWEWLKDGVPLNISDNVMQRVENQDDAFVIELEMVGVVESDSGSYQCRIYSTLGEKTVTFEPIMIVGIDVSSIGHPTNSSALAIGMNLDLTCQVTFRSRRPLPPVSVWSTWTKEGFPLVSSQAHIAVSATERVNGSSLLSPTYHTTLSFAPLMQGDGGRYLCSASCSLADGTEVEVNHSRTLLVDSES